MQSSIQSSLQRWLLVIRDLKSELLPLIISMVFSKKGYCILLSEQRWKYMVDYEELRTRYHRGGVIKSREVFDDIASANAHLYKDVVTGNVRQ